MHDVAPVKDWVQGHYQQAQHILSVCSGARFLASAGRLKSQRFCTHQDIYTNIQRHDPDALLHLICGLLTTGSSPRQAEYLRA